MARQDPGAVPRVALGCDHAGLPGRDAVLAVLRERGAEVVDLGTRNGQPVDYPDFAHAVAEQVTGGRVTVGILLCGTGQGMAMAANRHPGVRAAVITDELTARMARAHNDANVACFGVRTTGTEAIRRLLTVFLDTPFEGGRHSPRVAKIEAPAAEPPPGP